MGYSNEEKNSAGKVYLALTSSQWIQSFLEAKLLI